MAKATAVAIITPNGTPGVLLACPCATHKDGARGAIVATPTSPDKFPKSRIHGFVTMAHSPIGIAQSRRSNATFWSAA